MKLFIEASALAHPRISGIGHNAIEIIRALQNLPEGSGFSEITLLVPFRGRKHIAKWGLENVSCRYFLPPMKLFRLLDKIGLMPRLDWFYGQGAYLFPNYLNLPVSSRSRSFTYVHDVGFVTFPDFVSPPNRRYLQANVPKWLGRSNKVITISEFSKREIIDNYGVNSDKISVVLCGVDHNLFHRRTLDETEKCLAKYSIDARDYILYVGNIEPRKNILGILNAYDSLSSENKLAHPLMLIGGAGWLNEEIDAKIAQLRAKGLKIIRPGVYIEDQDLPAVYSAANMLVHPAYYEGFGISPLQAMACETPVITSNSASLPEVVGRAALLVEPDNIPQLANDMERLLTDKSLRKELSRKGLARSRDFTWQRAAQTLAKVIQSTAK